MRIIRICLIACAAIFGTAGAQEEPVPQAPNIKIERSALYYMTDMVHAENNRVEAWKSKRVADNKIITIKQPASTVSTQETQSTEWWDEIRTEGADTYLREHYAAHPVQLDPNEKSYGFVEERSVKDDHIITSWPIFYYVEGSDTHRQLVIRGFLPGGLQMRIVREYRVGSYFLPLLESQEIRDGDQVLSQFIYARMQ